MSLLRKREKGVEFFTVEATGESGMSRSGLARLCGVQESSIRELLDNLVRGKVTSESLKPLIGKEIQFEAKAAYKNAVIIRDEICAGVIEYYALDARKTTEEAKFALRKLTRMGIRSWIQGITGWFPPKVLPCQSDKELIEEWLNLVKEVYLAAGEAIARVKGKTASQQIELLRVQAEKPEHLALIALEALNKVEHTATHQHSRLMNHAVLQVDVLRTQLIERLRKSERLPPAIPTPMQPKNQRRLIEEFLTQLVSMSQQEKLALLYRVEGLTSQERARGNWSTRLIARYLGLHKNSYRTVAKIVNDRQKQDIDSNLGRKR